MKKLQFSIGIDAPKKTVWNTMLAPDTYRDWTSEFTPGSYYEGSWEKGAKIRFLSPDGEGMASEIAENRQYELIAIRHLGFIKDGREDTESPEVKEWAPAFEVYSFSGDGDATELTIEVDATPDDEPMLKDLWPKALSRLKTICEQ